MWPTVFRMCALAVTVSAVPVGHSAADPVVLRNGSGILGELSFGSGSGEIRTVYATPNSPPLSGIGPVQDGRVLTVGDTRLTSSAEVTTNISPLTFSATGGIAVGTQQPADSTSAGVPQNAQAISLLNIQFTLAEPRAFTYTGRYFGLLEPTDGITFWPVPNASATLFRVIDVGPNRTATVTYFRDSFFRLFTEQLTEHSGILEPGFYSLQADSAGRLEEPNMRITAGYAVTLSFAPEPIPEPATLLLATSGLTAVLAVARRRRRHEVHHG